MNKFRNSPESILIQSRVSPELNQKAIQAELKAMYCRKAWRCGLSLGEYCKRFSIRGVV